MSNVEELVKVDESGASEAPIETAKRRGRGRPKKNAVAAESTPAGDKAALQPVEQEIITEQEIERRRDILVSVAVLGQLQDYVGEDVPPAKIRTTKVDRLNSLFTVYQAKLGQELTFDTMDAVVSTAIKGLTFFMSFDDNEALKQDLLKNKGLRQILGKQAAGVSEEYEDFVAFGRIFFDIVKHIKFSEAQEQQQVQGGGTSTTPESEKKDN